MYKVIITLQDISHILFLIFIANLLGMCYYVSFQAREIELEKVQSPA